MFNIKWIANTSIFNRLLMASIIVAIIPGVVIFLLGSTYIQTLNTHGQAVQVSTDAVKVATTQLANLEHMNADLIALQAEQFVAIGVAGTQDARIGQIEQTLTSEINSLQAGIDQTLTRYQRDYQLTTSNNMDSVRNQLASNATYSNIAADQQDTLQRVTQQEWQAYIQAQSQVLQAIQAKQPSTQTNQLLQAANNKYAPLDKDWTHIVTLAETVGDKIALVDTTQRNTLIMYALVAVALIVIIVLLIGVVVNQTIARPLRQLATLTRRISRGDTSARAPIMGNDEIYLVAQSMNGMLDNIVQLIRETQGQRDMLQAQIERLMGEVMGIGGGDLQVRAGVIPGTLGILAEFFNYMVEALSSLVIRVKQSSREVEASTSVTFNVLMQLVKSSDLQLSGIAEAAVEIEQMANSTRQVANRTNSLYNVAHEAQSAIQKGRHSVRLASEGMQRIHNTIQDTSQKVQTLDEHSNEINEIIAVISNIAQQMNRLARDAAGQAAAVGEHGKGFGVVAGDIQRLAERTNGQVSSIAQIVQGVRQDIHAARVSMQDTERESSHGAKLAEEAGEAMETVFAAVEQQAEEMNAINRTAMQQLQSFSSIVNVMHLMTTSTQQISASTRQASQSLEYLARQVQELRRSVEAFKLPQTAASSFTTDPGSGPLGRARQPRSSGSLSGARVRPQLSSPNNNFGGPTTAPLGNNSNSGVRPPLPQSRRNSAPLRTE